MPISLINFFKSRDLSFSLGSTGKKNLLFVANGKCVIRVDADVGCPENPVVLRSDVGVLPSRPGNMGRIYKNIAKINNSLVMKGYGLSPSDQTKKVDLVWLYPSDTKEEQGKITSQLHRFSKDISFVKSQLKRSS